MQPTNGCAERINGFDNGCNQRMAAQNGSTDLTTDATNEWLRRTDQRMINGVNRERKKV
jgi:hypothetical protein